MDPVTTVTHQAGVPSHLAAAISTRPRLTLDCHHPLTSFSRPRSSLSSSWRLHHHKIDNTRSKTHVGVTATMDNIIAHLGDYQMSQFFSADGRPTQQECDETAKRITGETTEPSSVQGGSSYTVIAGDYLRHVRLDCYVVGGSWGTFIYFYTGVMRVSDLAYLFILL